MPGNLQITYFGEQPNIVVNDAGAPVKDAGITFESNEPFPIERMKNSTVSSRKILGSIPIICAGISFGIFRPPILRYGFGVPVALFGLGIFYGHTRDYYDHRWDEMKE